MKLLSKKSGPSGDTPGITRRTKTSGGALDIRHQVNQAFERMWHSLGRDPRFGRQWKFPWPAIDMVDQPGAIVLRVDAPGLKTEDVSVEVAGHLLIVRGSRRDELNEKKAGWYRHERAIGSFYRTVPLPNYVGTDKVEAALKDGVLTVSIPQKPGAGPRKITLST